MSDHKAQPKRRGRFLRVARWTLAVLLVLLGLLFIPVWLVWGRTRRNAGPVREAGPSLSPLERALRLVEWASRRPSVDERREALEALAFELGQDPDGDSADRARKQGWSPPSPEPEGMTELVASIREGTDAPAS